ncbi:putative sterigmatocystin biosynthesis monooxygenase stcW [Colletotrichum tanaceti]|uniref:Putative sterigmatocystin biosynthesis monooxygenase stcW n=1 Tax=Colletotrichum tanaceti TaxID=1306861 RepID=A0A4U6XJA4_9PEZI|nr:putative sterigmatocystin biosynthesis monooxygenase stcW [Colletotrichum tanaceti]TKW54197.1 putative sterigmatocystin biosynthesis monooxygenase stcW [Colletotrichum tanaceti]
MTRQIPQLSRHVDVQGSGSGHADQYSAAYTVREAPFGTPRPIRIIGVGAGASGINLIRTLRNTLGASTFELTIYEKNEDVGGTWFENRYPGCKCDVPSHNYQFTWRPNPAWSSFFAPAAEIQEYLCRICDDENLRSYIKTSHRIVGAVWSEPRAVWDLQIKDLETGAVFEDYANFFIDSTGILNKWRFPDVEGLSDFDGPVVHSANWPKDFDYANKTVAVIGNGASGVQIVPAIRPHVKKLHHIIRTPALIIPPRITTMKMGPSASVLEQIEMDEEERFSAATIAKFQNDRVFYKTFAQTLEMDSNIKFAISLVAGSPQQTWALGKTREFMTAMLGGNERLCKQLIPDFPLGCKRLTPAPGYLESFRDPRVSLHTDCIKRVLSRGIQLSNGEVLEVDAIICATGFDTSFRPAFPLVGRHGNLQDIWSEQTPKAYMSLAVAGLPNYFKFLGPNAPIAQGDVFTLSEHIANYIATAIRKCQTQGIRSIAPSEAAVDDYFEHITAFMPRTVFAGGCRSWYKQGEVNGPVTGLYPGSRTHFIQLLEHFRGEDWDYTYENARQNRFAYLGNGFTAPEMAMLKAGAPAS